jgi:tetratricopeptide (TPR) repeat protein
VFVYDSTIRVPMMVRFPPSAMRRSWQASDAARVHAAVSVADVFPTAVDYLGLGAPGSIDGVSLGMSSGPGRGVYFESYYGRIYYGWSPLAGWADDVAKYVHSSAPELYATDADPGETRNVVGERDAAPYLAALAALSRKPALDAGAGRVDQAMLAELEKLGYAGAGGAGELPGPLELDPALPSPHGRAAELAAIVESWSLDEAERPRAIALLEALVAQDPKNHGCWSRLGRLLQAAGEPARAAVALEHVRDLDVPGPEDRYRLALCYVALERNAEAAEALESALALDPDNVLALERLFAVYQGLERPADAARIFARLEAARRD